MPRKDAPEFSYDEKTGLYRKRIKNPSTGKWVAVYGHTKQELREKIKLRQQAFAAEAAAVGAPMFTSTPRNGSSSTQKSSARAARTITATRSTITFAP